VRDARVPGDPRAAAGFVVVDRSGPRQSGCRIAVQCRFAVPLQKQTGNEMFERCPTPYVVKNDNVANGGGSGHEPWPLDHCFGPGARLSTGYGLTSALIGSNATTAMPRARSCVMALRDSGARHVTGVCLQAAGGGRSRAPDPRLLSSFRLRRSSNGQIGELPRTALKGTKALLQSTAVDVPGAPVTVTSLDVEGEIAEAKLTAPGPKVKCVFAGSVPGPPLWPASNVGCLPSKTTLSSVIVKGLFCPLSA
jgi:hypothetical protein